MQRLGSGGEVLDEQRIHHARQPDMQLADPALRRRYDRHADELRMSVECGDVSLVAGNAIQGFGQFNVELPVPGVLQTRPVPLPQDYARAEDVGILVSVDDFPLPALRFLLADAELVLDQALPLAV